MRKLSLFVLSVGILCVFGCKPPHAAEPQPSASAKAGGSSVAGGGSDDIRPLTPGAGPITPVAGGEGLGGTSGGGVAQVAKERAKSAAANASSPSQTASGDD